MSILVTRLEPCLRGMLTAALLACASSSSLAVTSEMGRLFYTRRNGHNSKPHVPMACAPPVHATRELPTRTPHHCVLTE